jgi:hypothetical protein
MEGPLCLDFLIGKLRAIVETSNTLFSVVAVSFRGALLASWCWGVRKSEGVPEHKRRGQKHASHERQGDKESPKACTRLKSCESLYTCHRDPFYRETKELLHSENTLESKEYSQCEHIQECPLHPMICGANFIHLQVCH